MESVFAMFSSIFTKYDAEYLFFHRECQNIFVKAPKRPLSPLPHHPVAFEIIAVCSSQNSAKKASR